MASPPSATGSMWTRNPPNVAPLQIPTSMFCGVTVTDSTEPPFEPMERPMWDGVGRTRSGRRAVEVDEGEPLNGDQQIRQRENDEARGHTSAECGVWSAELMWHTPHSTFRTPHLVQISQLENSTPWVGGCSG